MASLPRSKLIPVRERDAKVWARLYIGDALEIMKTFESESVDLCMTSPPY
jgi:predicted methyltransferase